MSDTPLEKKRKERKNKIQSEVQRAVNKLKSSDGIPQVHAQRSFYQLVGEANQKALEPFINEQIQRLGNVLANRQNSAMTPVLIRMKVLEDLLIEKLGETEDSLADRVIAFEDKTNGYAALSADATIERGDYVRARVSATENGGDKIDEQSIAFTRVGTEPYESNKDFEEALIGMKKGETKDISKEITPARTIKFSLTVDRVSRKLNNESTKTEEESSSTPATQG